MLATKLRQFVERLTQNDPTLQQLDLGGNSIGEAGAQAIADALRENSTLQQLDLSDNGIGSPGSLTPASQAGSDSDSESDNEIEGAGARAIADALRQNSTLQQLELVGNDIQEAGKQAIKDILRSNVAQVPRGAAMSHRVFVYGSLLPSLPNHDF